MTKNTNFEMKRFSVLVGGKEYSKSWERIFGKKKGADNGRVDQKSRKAKTDRQ
jgi:hypothetical protein